MKSRLMFVFTVLSLLVSGTIFALTASAGPDDVCAGTKIDVENLPATVDGVTITLVDENTVHFDIPRRTIVEVCVKAGSANQGDGPEYLVLTADADVVHSSGKELSHVSVVSVTRPTPTPTPRPTPTHTPRPTPTPTPSEPALPS